jgi:hypothetical protein
MRSLPFLVLLLTSCGWVEREREEAAEAARQETVAEIERVLAETTRRAARLARSADRVLSPLPVMTRADEEALRRFLNAAHVRRAGELGVRAADEAARDSLVAAGRLVPLEDSTRHWIVRPGDSPAHVVPSTRALLQVLATRFHERLSEIDVPPYRIEVTSALRTADRQAELRGSNTNAAAGVSSHEFGTTVDLSYAAFAPPADPPPEIFSGVPARLVPHVEQFVDLAFESVSARKSRELGAIFSEVLEDAQAEGLALVIYERQQTVYHVTVGRALDDGEPGSG